MGTSAARPSLTLAGLLIALSGAVLFSTKAIIVKLAFAHTPVDAVTLLTLRMIFSLPFYIIAAFVIGNGEGTASLTGRQWFLLILVGLVGYYLSSLFDFLGLRHISAGLERLILFLYPTFTVLINRTFFKQKIRGNQALALLLTYLGIGIAFFGEMHFNVANSQFLLGSFLVFICAVTYALYLVGSGRLIPQVGASRFTAYSMLVATIGIFTHFMLTGKFSTLNSGANLWLYGILLAVVATVIPSFLLSGALKKIGSNNVAIISGIGPVSTVLQAHYFLGEDIIPAQIWGTVLVVIGILLLGWKKGQE